MTPPLAPSSYGHLIDLGVTFDRTARHRQHRTTLLGSVATWLREDAGRPDIDVPPDEAARRRLIARLLTVRPPRPIPSDALQLLDDLFADEALSRPVVGIADLAAGPRSSVVAGSTQLHLWRGDITSLAVDAIVNAANDKLLGCFRPEHTCIDNAIHSVAGPRLREDCWRIVDHQGHPEPTGTAKITRGYYLPSRFVLHTVGPIVVDGRPLSAQRVELARCYEACLDVAADLGLRSVAFCAISTGVFGYPKEEAAVVALTTVRTWLERQTGALEHVVFDVFSEADEAVYLGPGRFE